MLKLEFNLMYRYPDAECMHKLNTSVEILNANLSLAIALSTFASGSGYKHFTASDIARR